ncbi:MAG: signal peptidase I [Verrucomicrobiota bacterium]
MFSKKKKIRKRAGEFAEMARKIINYRKDQLGSSAIAQLKEVGESASAVSAEKDLTNERLTSLAGEWDSVLRQHGGKVYPKTFISDNVETFLVAAIIVLGIRAFFLQPFIIPTNSMYPTYSGMYHQLYEAGEGPSLLEKPFRFVLFGARNQEVVADSNGALRIPLFINQGPRAAFEVVDGKKWIFVPTKLKRYFLYVGNQPVSFDVPIDFDADSMLIDRYFPDYNSWSEVVEAQQANGGFSRQNARMGSVTVAGGTFQSGDTVLDFDVLSGDALFVDRFSYHFFAPKVGDPIVFRTNSIDYPRSPLGEKYYIKRLAGTEGDVLAIEPPALLIDGEVARGNVAFEKNAEQIDGYRGYVNDGPNMDYLTPGTTYEIPEDQFFALGDNSNNSLDSRYWGSFDEDAVIGKALFIYFPFTKRWGPAE